MQIDINPDASEYKETIYFGLTVQQCICCVLAIVTAVLLFFLLRPYLGTEFLSWACMLGAAPFAAMGFFSYHGMTAEQFLWNLIHTAILTPKLLYRDIPEQSADKEDDHVQSN